MRKLLRPQDIFLLGLTATLDIFEEIKDPLHAVSRSYENMYGWTPKQYKRHNFNHLVWRSLKAGYIEKIEKKGNIYIRITSQGTKTIKRDFPLFNFQKKPWDGKWRIIMFDIAELDKRKRNYLRRKLKELGFGMLQKSVFITPHDIVKDFSEYIDSIDLNHSVYILEAFKILAGSQKELARKVWKMDQLNEKYLEVFEEAKNGYLTLLNDRPKKLNGEEQRRRGESEGKIREIKRKYLNILLSDPFLPKELLPYDWMGEKAKKLIKNL